MKRYGMLIFVVVCVAVMIQQLLAQQEPKAKDVIVAGSTVPSAATVPASSTATLTANPAVALAPEEEVCKGCVTLDLEDADIKNVLQILSYKAGVNIVPTPDVQGLVTIKLKNVTWQDALNVILRTYGYGYDQRGSVIIVTTIENLKKMRENAAMLEDQESVSAKTFILDYADAAEVVGSIEKLITPKGSINFDKRTNVLIVRDIPSNLELISVVVERLDATTPQVLIEAKIIETTLTDEENMGIDWVFQAGASGAKRPTYYPFTQSSDNKYLKGMPFPTPDADLFTFGILDFSQMSAVLEMLKTRSGTDTLSNPRIVTLDNQKANIVVGSQYPLPQYTYNEEQAKLQVSGWEYKDIGIIFEVTPHVNKVGHVTLKVEPKITAILDYVTVESTKVPRLSTESASTNVMVKDGQTLVIAGLIKKQWTDTKSKVPILGDIPLAGLLFRKSDKKLEKTELIVFITPHVIVPDKVSSEGELKESLKRFDKKME